jgi:hypothetical protein
MKEIIKNQFIIADDEDPQRSSHRHRDNFVCCRVAHSL